MHKLEIEFTGVVLDLRIELEGKEIGLYFDGISTWTRTLEEFEIEGRLDIVMLCKGVNGTRWLMKIWMDGKGPKLYSGVLRKGYSVITDEIELPLN